MNDNKHNESISLNITDPEEFEMISNEINSEQREIYKKSKEIALLIAQVVKKSEKYVSETYDGMNMSKILSNCLYHIMVNAQLSYPEAKSQNYFVTPTSIWDKMEQAMTSLGHKNAAIQIRKTIGKYFINKENKDCHLKIIK